MVVSSLQNFSSKAFFAFVGCCFVSLFLQGLLLVAVDAQNSTYPIDQVFVIDVQEYSFENSRGVPAETAQQIVWAEFLSYFGDDVEIFNRNEAIPDPALRFRRGQRGRTLNEEERGKSEGKGEEDDGPVGKMQEEQPEDTERYLSLNLCPDECRQKPFVSRCQVLFCARSGGVAGRRLFLRQPMLEVDDVETISFDFVAAKQAMYSSLQPYASNVGIWPDLATGEDYTNAVDEFQFPVVTCVPNPNYNELCAFRTYFVYPDVSHVSVWFVSRSDFSSTTRLINNDYFENLQDEDYFRTILTVENDSVCRVAIERTANNPSMCASCTICNLQSNIFSVDCSNLYADSGIEVFGQLWQGSNTACEFALPVFFPLESASR